MPVDDSRKSSAQAKLFETQRQDGIQRLQHENWDVLIVGGGINGAGLARDLALRNDVEKLGLKIALIDKAHFGSGTSSKNSQLVHGGLRYLKYLNLSLVREALHERKTLMRIAPHLVRPQPFLLPFRHLVSSMYFATGLFLYDALAGKSAIQPFRRVSHKALTEISPTFHHAHSAAIFYDCVMEAARLVLANIQDAEKHGATAVNYLSADRFLFDAHGRTIGIAARDTLSDAVLEIKARIVVNAAGPWGDMLRHASSPARPALRLVRGSHLVFPQLFDDHLAMSFFENDGRIVFAIPWGANGELTLVGTTEAMHTESPDRVHMSADESDYLINAVSHWLPDIRDKKPVGSYSSLRPLINGDASSLSSASRDARIWLDENGVVNIAGGKYTTYRAMAVSAAMLVGRQLQIDFRQKELSAAHPLGALAAVAQNTTVLRRVADEFSLDEKQIQYLARLYGDRLEALLSISRATNGLGRIHPALPAILGQISYAILNEQAVHLSDFTIVSTYVRYYRRWTRAEILRMAEFMGAQLGWDAQRVQQETESELLGVRESAGVA